MKENLEASINSVMRSWTSAFSVSRFLLRNPLLGEKRPDMGKEGGEGF